MPHGPIVETLLERGFNVYSINPKQLDRFRDRFSPAGAKDDSREAEVLVTSSFLLLSFSSDLSCQIYIWQPHVKIVIFSIQTLQTSFPICGLRRNNHRPCHASECITFDRPWNTPQSLALLLIMKER
jgi:hypothetical protein